jgi:hypothetical protein
MIETLLTFKEVFWSSNSAGKLWFSGFAIDTRAVTLSNQRTTYTNHACLVHSLAITAIYHVYLNIQITNSKKEWFVIDKKIDD